MEQVKRDMAIIGLLGTMWDTYEFVNLANALSVIKNFEKPMKTLTLQTTECAYFIQRYARMSSLSMCDLGK